MQQQYHFHQVEDLNDLSELKSTWRKTLTAPQDGMWETLTDYANHWELRNDQHRIGYASVDDESHLLQFFILPHWMPEGVSVLEQFIAYTQIKNGLIGTNNPIGLALTLPLQQSVEIHTYMFKDFFKVAPLEKQGILSEAQDDDLEKLVEFCHRSMGAPSEWLNGYLGNLIKQGALFAFEEAGQVLGTCEVRKSDSNPSIVDIGMVVAPTHRRKGLGTFLLGKAKEIAYQWDRHPVCSCEKDNLGSLKAIRNNGFRSVHQMLWMAF